MTYLFRGNSYTTEETLKGFFNKRASKLCSSTDGNFKILKQKTVAQIIRIVHTLILVNQLIWN